MNTSFFLLFLIISLTSSMSHGWRSQNSGGIAVSSTSSTSPRGRGSSSSGSSSSNSGGNGNQLNVGLIAPHTNFGKRQYSQAINSAISNLQKMRDTKLGFLRDYEFKAHNVHFDMMTLTPSPTSKLQTLLLFMTFLLCFTSLSHTKNSHSRHNV